MPIEVLKVDRVDHWPPQSGQQCDVWIVRAVTMESVAHSRILRTVKPWQASLCQQVAGTSQRVRAEWRAGFGDKSPRLLSVELA